jgi:hypothetical protein
MFGNSDAALFFVSAPGDLDHLAGFREHLTKASAIPLFPITPDPRMATGEPALVAGDATIRDFFVNLVNRIVA